MSRPAEAYQQQLDALLPPGIVWDALRSDALLQGVLLAWADELARVETSDESLLDEADPNTTDQLLAEWEAFASLPDSCSPGDQTLQQRRAALAIRLAGQAPVSRPDLIAAAAAMGITITITEYHASRYGEPYGGLYGGIDWQFTWEVAIPGPGPETLLECMVSRYAPAGFIVRFNYV